MSNLIVKSNAFVGASYGLGTVEHRLILLAILKARETDSISEAIGKTLTIHASDYMAHFGSSLNAYNSACSVMASDDDWQDAGTLQEMQTVVLLADLLKVVLDAKSSLDLHNALEAEEKTKK